MNAQPKTMAEFAALENAAMRAICDDTEEQRRVPRKNIAEKIRPFIGSGKSQTAVAEILGCSNVAVFKALKKLGAKL